MKLDIIGGSLGRNMKWTEVINFQNYRSYHLFDSFFT
jgi:hypothetical protein